MNSSYFFSGVSRYATILLILFTAPVVLNAAAKTNHTGGKQIHASTTTVIRPSQTLQQRAQDAAHQLLQYQRHMAKKMKSGQTTPFGIPPKNVGITVRKDIQLASTIFFQDDFESGTNGWTVATIGDTTAQWHQTTSDFTSPSHSWWQGVESQGTYATGHRVKGSLISPSINLSGALGNITLLFAENYCTEHHWDFCMVDLTTDSGATWTNLRGSWGFAPSGSSEGWNVRSLNLTPHANQTIQIRFAFDTGDSLFNDFPGWFVDDVVIFDQSATLAGDVYFDKNRNGTRDWPEPTLDDWLITASGPITVTTPTYYGYYDFSLPLGSYQVSEEVPYPWTQISPPGPWSVDLNELSGYVDTISFGNYRPECLITGTAFNDLNKDSVRSITDSAMINSEIDLMNPSGEWIADTHTDSSGNFSLLVADSGNFKLQQYLPSDWVSTVPGGRPPQYTVAVPNVDTTLSGYLFGNYYSPYIPPPNTSSITGYVFNDLNVNKIWDNREPILANVEILAVDTNSDWYWTQTDSTGRFAFLGAHPGTYILKMYNGYQWGQSLPDSTYTITVGIGETKDSVLFGTYLLPTGTIRGTVYNDLNRNGTRDSLEPGLKGWTVSVGDPYIWTRSAVTDSSGNYTLSGIIIGSHTISVVVAPHWHASPLNPTAITLSADQVRDSMNFGVYALQPGSISGDVFIDANANGVHDTGESPLKNSHIILEHSGTEIGSMLTDDTGHFRFNDLWAGTYTLSMALNSQWRQTYPLLLQNTIVTLGDEENQSGFEFGATNDTTLNPAFRSFIPESIAFSYDLKGKIGKAVPAKYTACQTTFDLMVPDTALTGIHIEFSQVIDVPSLAVSRIDPTLTFAGTTKKFDFKMHGTDTLSDGEHITVFARGNMGKELYITKYWWIKGSVSPFPPKTMRTKIHGTYSLLYPMPNVNNLLLELYASGTLDNNGIEVGDAGTPRYIYHPKWTDLLKSLVYHGIMPANNPTCIGHILPNKPVTTRPYKTLRPDKGSNRLYSEAIALKVNITLSDLIITPAGFGSLIFRGDSTNPFNGLSVYDLARLADTAISSFDFNFGGCRYDSIYFAKLYHTIRMVDSAFSGPFDINSWDGKTIAVKPIRYISDVPFLVIDTTQSLIARTPPGQVRIGRPQGFSLVQNYPNPFNPATRISFSLPASAIVTLTIYNTLGQEVTTLLNRELVDEGDQQVVFNASSLASGIYYYRLIVDGIPDEDGVKGQSYSAVRKMILLK